MNDEAEVPNPGSRPWFPGRFAEDVAVTNVNVVSMEDTNVASDMTVVVRQGRIEAIGPSSSIPTEGGVRVIDGTGKYLMPGLADMHVHYWDVGEFSMFLANGVTLVRNMWGSPFHLAMQSRVEDGEFPGPRVVTTSPIIDGPGPNGTTIWPNSALAALPEDGTALVREFAARGYRQTKAYSWLKLPVLQALGRASSDAGIRMVGHCPDGITYEEAVDAGMTCFEHLTGIAEGRLQGKTLLGMRAGSMEAMRTVVENIDLDSIRRLAVMLREREIWNCPTLVVWQGMAQEQSVAMSNPLLRYEPPALAKGWDPANDFRFRNSDVDRSEWLAMARRRIEVYTQIISILKEEGAPLLLGTDTPNPFVYQGFSIHDELDNLVRAGLTPYEALRTGTAEAARFLDEEDEWGTIAAGKRADLVLLSDDPLKEVAAVRDPEIVFVNGFSFTRGELQQMLDLREQSVSPSAGAPPPDLPRVAPSESVVREGLLTEEVAGANAGFLRFRHITTEDGRLVIEEVHASGADGLHSWGGEPRWRVELDVDHHIVRAEWESDSFLGREAWKVELDATSTYVVKAEEIDAVRSTVRLPGPLYPTADLGLTSILPLLNPGGEYPTKLQALAFIESKPSAVAMKLSRDDAGRYVVHVDRAGTQVEQSFTIDASGGIDLMDEQTWRGLRRVRPVDDETSTMR